MTDVIHATAAAIDVIRYRWNGENPQPGHAVPGVAACSAVSIVLNQAFIDDHAVQMLRGESAPRVLPTCQRCRVLLDEAWEHPVEVAP